MNISKQTRLLILLTLFAICGQSMGQWTKLNGPYGGTNINYFTSYENFLYAGSTSKGVFFSSDSGLSWKSIGNNQLIYDGVLSLLRIDTTIFAGTYYGLYKTTDNGLNWNKIKTGIPTDRRVYTLVMLDSIIFAGTDYGGIYRSADHGKTWVQVQSNLPDWRTVGIVSQGGKYFAGINCEGLYTSADSGKTWELLDSGIPPCTINAIAVHNNIIFSGSLFSSSDSGKSWQKSDEGITETVSSLISVGSYIFAGTKGDGVFRSDDYGKTWWPVNEGLYSLNIGKFFVFGTRLFVSTSMGVFLSTNFGESWKMVELRCTEAIVRALMSDGDNYYAGTLDGIFKSSDKGSTWIPVNRGMDVYVITSFLKTGPDIFAGTTQGLYQSKDNGAIWEYVGPDTTKVQITSLAKNDTTLFAAGMENKVYTSSDNGLSWETISLPDSVYPIHRPGIQCIAADNSNLFIGTYLYGVYRFNLETKILTQINTGLTHPVIYCLLDDGNSLFAGIRGGVFLSTDYGNSWGPVNNGILWIHGSFAVSSLTSTDNVLVAAVGHTVAISWNNGANWKSWIPYYDNFPYGISVESVLYQDSTIYIGTLSNGLWSYKIPPDFTVIEKPSPEISQYSLSQNYPNPFNPTTIIRYQLKTKSHVQLTIYDITGREVKKLVNQNQNAGEYSVNFNAGNFASGIYIYRLKTDSFEQSRKMILLR